MAIRTAVILAGGRGLRLAPLTNGRPKPMIDVLSKPLLQWTVESLVNQGIRRIVMGVAYKKEKVIDYFKDGKEFGVDICYSEHTVEGGTAEGFRFAISRFVNDETFLAMNGDELIDVNLEKLSRFHSQHKPVATVVTKEMRSPFGILKIDTNDDIVKFEEKPIVAGCYISTGVYMFDHEILSHLPSEGDIERTAFRALAESRKLKAFKHDGYWITVNNLKDLAAAEEELRRMQYVKCNIRV